MELIGKEKLKQHCRKSLSDDASLVKLIDCIIDQQPVVDTKADAVFVESGFSSMLTCSNCHRAYVGAWDDRWVRWNFCPICGAAIKKGESDDSTK